MLAPISWLKDFVTINTPTKELAWRLTELGLGIEAIKRVNNEEVFELEITPNRPDLLSIIGIAREIGAVENTKINIPEINLPAPKIILPMKVHSNFELFTGYTGIVIDNVSLKPSPKWLSDRLVLIGLRPINNIVDITNYVMYELGIPLHAFDYNEILGSEINVVESKGGEDFTSVDNLTYKLPKGAIIIYDNKRIIDLCGIKGGLNSGIKGTTHRVYLQVTADDPVHIRKTSQALNLRSDASAIFERGVDKGSLLSSLMRAAQLILDLSGGVIASEIIDLKKKEAIPIKQILHFDRLNKMIGMEIAKTQVFSIFENLSLSPKYIGNDVEVTIPTYRQDLKIEEDLIEEVARFYGYNNMPKTIPNGTIPVKKVSYYKNFSTEEKVKNILSASGFTEIYSYSLIGKAQFDILGKGINDAIRINNPVSLDYEYLRPALLGNMLDAIKLNEALNSEINLFELGRIYKAEEGESVESDNLIIASNLSYRFLKGATEELFSGWE